jgi:Flp pilus assembly protein CpaB
VLTKLVRNSRNLIIFGALLAAVAFVLAFEVLNKAQPTPAANAAQVAPTPTPIPAPALIARADVPAFTPITDLSTVSQYFQSVPVSGYVDPDYVKGSQGLAQLLVAGPRHLAIRIPKGQPLLNSELVSNTVAGAVDYSTLLNPGEVAEAISVGPVAAVNGVIQPSDHVDLLMSIKFDLTKDAAARHPFYTDNGTVIGPSTTSTTWVGSLWETQTTIQNLRVLGVAGTTYTLAMSHQDALLLKWVKDEGGTVDLVVRAGDDSGRKPTLFHTTAVLPDYVIRDAHMTNKFVLP